MFQVTPITLCSHALPLTTPRHTLHCEITLYPQLRQEINSSLVTCHPIPKDDVKNESIIDTHSLDLGMCQVCKYEEKYRSGFVTDPTSPSTTEFSEDDEGKLVALNKRIKGLFDNVAAACAVLKTISDNSTDLCLNKFQNLLYEEFRNTIQLSCDLGGFIQRGISVKAYREVLKNVQGMVGELDKKGAVFCDLANCLTEMQVYNVDEEEYEVLKAKAAWLTRKFGAMYKDFHAWLSTDVDADGDVDMIGNSFEVAQEYASENSAAMDTDGDVVMMD